ncbi:MAG: cbb3-type cytochrome c oxidase subunit 3 [Deltaproteobacteria bacterium]|nr:cbb3-type cytochrome c oxidase subunit 3 [Deltaproteobacteria bacterium]
MKSDIMGHANLWGWAVAALVLFCLVFATQVWRTFAARNKAEFDRAAGLPLADGTLGSQPEHPNAP